MKRFLLYIIFLTWTIPAIAQGWWVFVSGTVTDTENGLPVVGHQVTIMADSTFGFYYYNVVLTDSTGYYHDEVPIIADSIGFLYIQTTDCNGYVQQFSFVFNPVNNTVIQDFQVCTSNPPCESVFVYYPDPPDSPDSFLFIDLSSGNISSWQWDFGDGTSSDEKNPYHSFPGPGSYTTCLTVSGNDCSDTYCQEIIISDTVYQQIYGQVFAGNFPAQSAMVILFALNPNGGYSPVDEGFPADSNGIYYFTLVPSGTYMIQAVPFDSVAYLPTYYGDVTNWQSAAQVVLGEPDNPYNINLVGVPAGSEYFGTGSITGQINNLGMNRTLAENVNMILLDENIRAIGFTKVSNTGQFEFPSLDYGTYHLRAELPGVGSDNMKFEISPEKPHLQVVMNYTGNSVLGLQDQDPFEGSFTVYPNPVKDRLLLSVKLPSEDIIMVKLSSMTGNIVYKNQESVGMGEMIFEINVSGFSTGIYTLNVYSDNGMIFTRKVVIVR
ncbi:MAG: T9SS type A sorting domain-containing protein [Bacteroidales bacterium]|nr:T9SS type A sorting domain-containing protein [Bacteroidales bacterium]